MLERVLEPEVMDTVEEAESYDAMDHRAVNLRFVEDTLALRARPRAVLDVGCGTALLTLLLASRLPESRVVGVDLAAEMLRVAQRNVAQAQLLDRVCLVLADAKGLPYAPGDFDLLVSNSIVHHVPSPSSFFAELSRLRGEGTAVLVRDLVRPASAAALADLVERYAGSEPERARALFGASLHAALTLEEVRALARDAGLSDARVELTSDRHWTLTAG